MSTTATRSIPHGAAGSRIADHLREAILNGDYRPGARITQEDLAGLHGASRLPVRDALRMLEGEGLVTLKPNAGAWVSRLSLSDCEEMYQIRERLEPLLLRYNMPMLDDTLVEHLVELAALMEETDDVERFLALDREFHLSVYAHAETSVLAETVRQLWNRTQHYRRAFMQVFRTDDRSVHHEHHLLVAAIRRGDVEEAERVLAGHIRRTRLELAAHPEIFAD